MKDPSIDREWIKEFGRALFPENDHPLTREFVIQERDGYFDLYQTFPEHRLMVRLTLDEILGYSALAIVNGRPPRMKTIDDERAWRAKYAEPEPLEAGA